MTEKTIRVQFGLPRALRTRLERYAAAKGMTLSACIRQALEFSVYSTDVARPAKRPYRRSAPKRSELKITHE